MSHLCKGEKEAQEIVHVTVSNCESQQGKEEQQTKPSDLVTSSTFPETINGHTVALQVNGTAASFLVDTGSAVSLIRHDLWEKSRREQNKLEPWTKQLVSVDGSPVSVLGILPIENQYR